MLDNPGLVTQACGNVLDKWDGVWREKEADLANTYRVPGSEGAVLADIDPCRKPKPSAGECFDNQVEETNTNLTCFYMLPIDEVLLRHN